MRNASILARQLSGQIQPINFSYQILFRARSISCEPLPITRSQLSKTRMNSPVDEFKDAQYLLEILRLIIHPTSLPKLIIQLIYVCFRQEKFVIRKTGLAELLPHKISFHSSQTRP